MLTVSSSDIFQRYWGDDEKAISAAFRLARRLHPCIMFVDEADGLLGKRQDDDKKYVRSLLSEFLRQWDGSLEGSENNPFVLLATNMPWDLDPAVLRRAPLRILIDLPKFQDRKGILGILLGDEKLEEGLTVETLAKSTRSFTGSDLKNLCVSAAMKCIQEQEPDENGEYQHQRILRRSHFDYARLYIKPSGSNILMLKRLSEFQANTR